VLMERAESEVGGDAVGDSAEVEAEVGVAHDYGEDDVGEDLPPEELLHSLDNRAVESVVVAVGTAAVGNLPVAAVGSSPVAVAGNLPAAVVVDTEVDNLSVVVGRNLPAVAVVDNPVVESVELVEPVVEHLVVSVLRDFHEQTYYSVAVVDLVVEVVQSSSQLYLQSMVR
jgi:hypothetical protein